MKKTIFVAGILSFSIILTLTLFIRLQSVDSIEKLIRTSDENIEYSLLRNNVNQSCWYEYPVLTGIDDEKLQTDINKKLAYAIEKPYYDDNDIQSYTGPIESEIPRLDYIGFCKVNLCNNQIISVAFCIQKS